MNIKGVIFDLDGVIVDTEGVHYKAYKKAFEHVGIELSQEDYNTKVRSQGRAKGIKNIIGHVTEELMHVIGSVKDRHYFDIIDKGELTVYADAVALIETCQKKDIPMAIGTTSSHGAKVLDRLGLREKFRAVITGGDVEHTKPAPDIYHMCRRALDMDKKELIIIEDSMSGIEAGLNAGIRVVHIDRDDGTLIDASKAAVSLNDLAELMVYI